MSSENELVIGIDFGVSTTVAAVARQGEPKIVKDQRGRMVIPSIVAFPPTGRSIVGEDAKERRPNDPANTIYSMKRIIGETWTSPAVRHFTEQYPFFELERYDDELPRFSTRQGLISAEDVSTKVLEHVRSILDRVNLQPSLTIIGVPSAFHERQRRATRNAASRAGFEEVICVVEPLAIAWACTHQYRKPDRKIAIYDLGGGTFDLALCEVRGGGVAIIGSGGDEYLGGEDIDQRLSQWVVDQVLRRHQWDIRTSPEAMARLLGACEKAKIDLSTSKETTIAVHEIEETDLLSGEELTIGISLLEKLTSDIVRRTFGVCDEVCAQAGVNVDDIDEVFLAGGTTNIPFLPDAVHQYFGKVPIVSPYPERLVALGTALIAQSTAR